MITLNDYLYDGSTILKILQKYSADLRESALETHNQIDLAHSNFLIGYQQLLEHNDFLTSQSQRIREFYKYMARNYPTLAFTFHGRIKSLIRAEEKFNAYIIECIYDYYTEYHKFPTVLDLKEHVKRFRDLIAYRIVISMPKCNIGAGEDIEKLELDYLYKIANVLPEFFEVREFSAEPSGLDTFSNSAMLNPEVKPYYRDYIDHPKESGYRSMHIALYDNSARSFIEFQLRNQLMDDQAEIGAFNHTGYEQSQKLEQSKREVIPLGANKYFDEAYERLELLQKLDLSTVDVNLFTALNNQTMNDRCGLMRGRLILAYEHLSRYQNDRIG